MVHPILSSKLTACMPFISPIRILECFLIKHDKVGCQEQDTSLFLKNLLAIKTKIMDFRECQVSLLETGYTSTSGHTPPQSSVLRVNQDRNMQRASFSIRTAKSEINLLNGNAEMLLTWLVFVFSDVRKQINVDTMLDVLQDNFILF